MKYLGVDYGTKRIGIAVSDEGGTFALPRAVVETKEAPAFIRELAMKEAIGTIVIGDTRSLSGASNTITEEMETFKADLAGSIPIPVETIWEAWSSHEAGRFAPEKAKDDSAAAAVILQRYLDMRKS